MVMIAIGVSTGHMSVISMLKDLWGLGENVSGSTRLRGDVGLARKPYIEFTQCHLKPRIPKNSRDHSSLELAFDPGEFIRDPSEIIACGFDQGVDGSAGRRWTSEVKSDG